MGTALQDSKPEARATDFGVLRATMLQQMEALERIGHDRGDLHTVAQIREVREKLLANRFYLAVLGQFKRGKTTLINSLLGAEVLPVAVVPLTSVITVLSYGDTPDAKVVFLSGDAKPIPIEQIAEYVSERQNPRNAKAVKQVEVRYPSPYLAQGILLVDTPGVASTYRHNTELAYSFLAHVDAAIFLLSVDPPLTNAEAEFLRHIKQEAHHFFFVLNKIDTVTLAEMRESLIFSAQQIRQETELGDVELFPLSARKGLEAKLTGDQQKLQNSGVPEFEAALGRFLMKDKGSVLLRSSLADVLRIASDMRFNLEVEFRAAGFSIQELEQKHELLEQELQRIKQDRSDMNVLLTHEIGRLIGMVESDLREAVEGAVPTMEKNLDEFLRRHAKASKKKLAHLLDEFMAEEIESVFNHWRTAEERRLGEAFQAMSARFSEKTNEMVRGIRSIASRVFEINVEISETAEPLRADSRFYYKTDPLFYFTIERLPFMLPQVLFRSYLQTKMRDRVRVELERNAGRLRYDYLERIERSIHAFSGALNLRIDAALNGILQALERASDLRQQSLTHYQKRTQEYSDQNQQAARLIEEGATLMRQLETC